MKEYILALAGVILLSAVVAVIAPGGRMGKFVSGITKLLPLFVLVAPLVGLIKGEAPTFEAGGDIAEDVSYFETCQKMLEREDVAAVKLLVSEFSLRCDAVSERDDAPPFARKKISVAVQTEGIIDADEHIHILTEIKEAVEDAFGCPAEVS